MTHLQKIEKILSFGPFNESIKFLCWRLKRDDYRGNHFSQHNRLTFEKFKALIIAVTFVKDDLGYIKIPPGDSKDFRIGDYPQYEKLINAFHKELKKQDLKSQGTANSIKKNLFPDLNRMGIINRFSKNNSVITILDPYSKKKVDFINVNSSLKIEENLLNDLYLNKIYEESTKNLYLNLLPLVNEILQSEKIKGHIDEIEFLFFITWYQRQYLNNAIFNSQIIIDMIYSWRKLDRSIKKELINFIKDWAVPKRFKASNKNQKRDFHNWKNETQNIMQHFKNTNLFTLNQNASKFELVFKEEFNKIKRTRSCDIKKEYIKNHNIKKEKGFEFDHIVPFSWSTTIEEAIKIENWKNLLYIDAKNHAIKTCTNNKYVFFDKRNINNKDYICLVANDKDFLSLCLNDDVYFDMKFFNEIKTYNLSLHELINDFEQ